MKDKIPYEKARMKAEVLQARLKPHCQRIEIAGSIRRQCQYIGDIEIVCIPKPYDVGLFASGVALVLEPLAVVRGQLPCKYTQRLLECGTKVDVFFATPDNWGLILAIRTGSARYSHEVLASNWVRQGYKSIDGMLHGPDGFPVPVPEEQDLFRACRVPYVNPQDRDLQ